MSTRQISALAFSVFLKRRAAPVRRRTQYVSEHFRNQVRFWGMEASYAFIEQPQTNGVAERFFRTLKEQIIHGRIYRTVADLRAAVEAFVDLYNEQWRPEKNGYMSPSATRAAWYAGEAQGVTA